jgi:hypothetical protein
MMYRKRRHHDSTLRDVLRIHSGMAAQRPSLIARLREGLRTMERGVVVVYFSRFGKPLQTHHKVVLDLGAKAIANIKGYEFGAHYDAAYSYSGPLFFVPDDTLLLDEAACLGIRSSNDLYGGVVPHLFVKTKAITHGLVDRDAERPPGWSTAFAERVREVVLPGYTVFSNRDAQMAARCMLTRGPIRLKQPLSASGKDQTVVTTLNELDALLETVAADEMSAYGLVLEENLRRVRTLSVGRLRSATLGSATTERKGPWWTTTGGRFTADPSSCACAAAGKFSMCSRCRPRYALPWLQQDDTMRRRRSSTISRHRGGTTMSLRESALTVGHNQACSSLPGASVARAAPNSRHWQRSRGIRR